MKRYIFLIAVLFASISSFATDFRYDNLDYTILDEGKRTVATRSGYYYYLIPGNSPLVENLVIPEKVYYNDEEYTVVEIGKVGFYNQKNITTLTLPSSIETIGEYAFYGCSSLRTIVIGESNQADNLEGISNQCTIEPHSFQNCGLLKDITFNVPIKHISASAFDRCENIRSVKINDLAAWCETVFGSAVANPTYYSRSLTLNGEQLYDLVIPEGVTKINSYAFVKCIWIETVTVPSSLKSIQEKAFEGCDIKSLNCNDIKAWASMDFTKTEENPLTQGIPFMLNGKEVTELEFPEGLTTIKPYTFCNLETLKSVKFPQSLTSIGNYAFYNCNNLETVAFPQPLKSIGAYTFYNCNNLKYLEFPQSLSSIGNYAFYKNNLEYLEFPQSLSSIGNYAFYDNSIKTIIFNNENPITLGNYAFGSNSVSKIYCVSQKYIPQGVYNSFGSYTYQTATVYVPAQQLGDYINDLFWSFFFNITDIESSGVDTVSEEGPDVVTVYSPDGRNLLNRAPKESLQSLPHGIYIVNGKKVKL